MITQARYAFFLRVKFHLGLHRRFCIAFIEADHTVVAGEEKKINGYVLSILNRISKGLLGFKRCGPDMTIGGLPSIGRVTSLFLIYVGSKYHLYG